VTVVEGFGTLVLGLVEASAVGVAVLPQPKLFQLIHDGDDQPQPAPDWQPLAANKGRPTNNVPTIDHRESVTRMANASLADPAGSKAVGRIPSVVEPIAPYAGARLDRLSDNVGRQCRSIANNPQSLPKNPALASAQTLCNRAVQRGAGS
jgi:hypothetical protein